MKLRILVPLGKTHSGDQDKRMLIPHRSAGCYSLGTSFFNAPIIGRTVAMRRVGCYEDEKAIFHFNLLIYSRSVYSHDGLADIALVDGDRAQSAALFKQSSVLDPSNAYANRLQESSR